ncbi:hypothetical protein HELRODRAFT_170434 [Helobdella robusta]|uniref:Uncharacterized protein n=1 Tax=Helobdella robusta TaxID=6412 RepID=T1F322_HELRO|nr:hypothetical protein HELRODRAFT_170434 [Helobdella robusta]ESO07132.1 hypothetical protein HELRODRAFT_170434 [Helobdella robusta]
MLSREKVPSSISLVTSSGATVLVNGSPENIVLKPYQIKSINTTRELFVIFPRRSVPGAKFAVYSHDKRFSTGSNCWKCGMKILDRFSINNNKNSTEINVGKVNANDMKNEPNTVNDDINNGNWCWVVSKNYKPVVVSDNDDFLLSLKITPDTVVVRSNYRACYCQVASNEDEENFNDNSETPSVQIPSNELANYQNLEKRKRIKQLMESLKQLEKQAIVLENIVLSTAVKQIFLTYSMKYNENFEWVTDYMTRFEEKFLEKQTFLNEKSLSKNFKTLVKRQTDDEHNKLETLIRVEQEKAKAMETIRRRDEADIEYENQKGLCYRPYAFKQKWRREHEADEGFNDWK